ncbi:HTH CENPB-type domain-containing protein [Trichonephila inaurata madagascariensis]|uniref:HTH CENPB-type domain-containing protein n=1 Tax=Trichonephila inaurata madagascariensis TaxID=2747483 RepID=A0A8X6Y558_9ARAC|nr:HTH CENPB-type domain-containing protein [Trichonephila inaurata madagascariensis]
MLMGEEPYNYAVDMLAEKNMIHDEELIHANEVCEEVFFESVEVDSSSDEYETEEKKREIKHIPLDYKIKAVNMAKKASYLEY